MIFTGSYKNLDSNQFRLVSISENNGKDANYLGESYPLLVPKSDIWKTWHDNIGVIDEYENNKFYIREYYEQVLSKLDPYEVYLKLDNSVLLCCEDSGLFCHRHIVAAWLELTLGVSIFEIKLVDNNLIFLDKIDYVKIELEKMLSVSNGIKRCRTKQL